tara:strand:+ start:1325 stop:2032 length:708 start_codon:yes stop_codon:yes gene_type:complete
MNVAIITARAGSKSIIDKNIILINKLPLIAYPISAAKKSNLIDKVFVTTDGEKISNISKKYGAQIIKRPESLGGDSINHGDVIKHAVINVEKSFPKLQNVVVLLGNTVMIDHKIIDQCLEKLIKDNTLDSVMTVWEAADDHPNRAMEIKNGFLVPYGGEARNVSTERQSYKNAYFYDQGVWAFKKENVYKRSGPSPWWWLGKNCKPIIRDWITGRDINGPFDVPFHEWWTKNGKR